MKSAGGTLWTITASDSADLLRQFGTLGIRVPTRSEPKDQFAEEMYCLRRLLFPAAKKGLLAFPLTVAKHETPDFLLTCPVEGTVGIEVTKATRKEFEADLTRLHRNQGTKHYPSDLSQGTMDLSVAGWLGDAAEREWVQYMIACVKEKVVDLESYSVGRSDLLIYDNTPTAVTELKKAAEALRLELGKNPIFSGNGRSFRVVSVIHDPTLVYDVAGSCQMLKYEPEWGIP